MNKLPDDPEPRRTASLAALVVVLLLVIGGIWLQRHIRANSILQDCVMSGRNNCAPVSP